MLIPPFTVMILKDSRRPVTIRVTRLLTLIMLMLAGGVFVVALMVVVPLRGGTLSEHTGPDSWSPASDVRLIATSPDTISGDDSTVPADWSLTGLTVEQSTAGDVEISFEILTGGNASPLLVWLVMNPHDAHTTQISVFPRSPLFKGLPVDFRNGIRFTPAQGKKLKATISGQLVGDDLERFRILAFTETGEPAIDRTITIEQNARM